MDETTSVQFEPSGSPNPYATTISSADVARAPTEVEQCRKAHLSHEASVKFIATLYLVGSVFVGPIGAMMVIAAIRGVNGVAGAGIIEGFIGVFFVGLGMFHGFVGYGLHRLQRWASIAASVCSGFWLLGFPVGTLIGGCFLHVLLSEKGDVVFSGSLQECDRADAAH